MRLDPAEARDRLRVARVARLATVTPDERPHVVPICFVVIGDTIFSAVDDKPKASPSLQRLTNIAARAKASVLADHYDEDWSELWWARADGNARTVADGDERAAAVDALRAKYAQYGDHTLDDAVLALDVRSWTGWAARPPAPGTRPAPRR